VAIFTTIDNTRVAAGKLWTPELSLDMMGNHWSALSGAFDWAMPEASTTGNVTMATFYMGFPSDYAYDATYSTLTYEIGIVAQIKKTGSAGSGIITATINGDSAAVPSITFTGSYAEFTFVITGTGAPSGITSGTLVSSSNPGDTLFIKRDFGAGPQSWFRIVST
jgi:hypothetical protein